MNSVAIHDFQRAIQATHGSAATLIARERVDERFEGQPVWQGEVLVFELEGHPEATRCYAWETDGEIVAVLGVAPVESAQDAVRASILAGSE